VTEIAKAVRDVISSMRTTSLPATTAEPVTVEIPPDLHQQVRLLTGRARFDDMVLTRAEPEHDLRAAALVAALRALDPPASSDRIERWLAMFVAGTANAPTDPMALNAQFELVRLIARKLPAACWTDETLAAAVRAFPYWPAVSLLSAFLDRLADDHRRDLAGLEAIAAAAPGRKRGPARASTEPYNPAAPDWVGSSRERKRVDDLAVDVDGDDRYSRTHPPIRTVREQIKALGLDPDNLPPLPDRRRGDAA
jgi:hypothetical protein